MRKSKEAPFVFGVRVEEIPLPTEERKQNV